MPRGKKNPLHLLLAQRLVWLRDVAGITQARLGSLAQLSDHTVSTVENAQGTCRISTVEQLATALGVSPVWLAFGQDGHLVWKERHPRFGIEPDDPPQPSLGARMSLNLHRGMAERLRHAREAKGWSMRELGRQAGCTVAAISLLEAGTSIVLLSTCEDLAKVLEVAPGWLAYGIGHGPAAN